MGFQGITTSTRMQMRIVKARVASAGASRVGGLTPNQVNSTVNQISGSLRTMSQ